MSDAAVVIDGDVGTFTTTARLLASVFMVRNVGTFRCRSAYYSYLLLGTPEQYVSNAYVSYDGSTNGIMRMSGGNLVMFKAAGSMQDTFVYAGGMPLTDVFSADLDALYDTWEPSGTIGTIAARALCGVGRFDLAASKWLPTCYVVGKVRPKLKIPAGRIITEGTSVYINQ